MISRTPRFVRWRLCAVAAAVPIAMIAPWPAQAGPEPVDALDPVNVSAPGSSAPLTRTMMGQDDDVAVGDPAPDPNPDPARRGRNNERHRALKEAPDGGGGKNPNPNCTLIVPDAPFTAQGLATPYQLFATNRRQGQCREANDNQSAFVEATIINPATGALSIYRPLVIDRGTRPGAPPVMPKLPAGSVVGLWFGFQGTTLTLRGATAGCVNGLPGSPFGQFAYCGAPEFFRAANAAIRAGKLKVPPVGTARDGQP
ncbi:MAG TPA: hypothetical protein VF788_20085, partial [Pseudonocardiaceae bacterium]